MTAPDVVLFDGVCGFCDMAIRLIIDKERAPHFKFAPMQSPVGQKLMAEHGLHPDDRTSYVLLTDGKAHQKSAATIRIAPWLRAPWRWMSALRFLPPPFVDFFYDIVARNRYRWFGKYDSCRLLTPELRARFLDGSGFE